MYNTNPNCSELIGCGKCKADCCGVVPIPERYFQRLKKVISKDKAYTLKKFSTSRSGKFVIAETEDLKCVFLDADFKCKIYNSPMRPEVCSLYGTLSGELICKHINEGSTMAIIKDTNDKIKKLLDLAGIEGGE